MTVFDRTRCQARWLNRTRATGSNAVGAVKEIVSEIDSMSREGKIIKGRNEVTAFSYFSASCLPPGYTPAPSSLKEDPVFGYKMLAEYMLCDWPLVPSCALPVGRARVGHAASTEVEQLLLFISV